MVLPPAFKSLSLEDAAPAAKGNSISFQIDRGLDQVLVCYFFLNLLRARRL